MRLGPSKPKAGLAVNRQSGSLMVSLYMQSQLALVPVTEPQPSQLSPARLALSLARLLRSSLASPRLRLSGPLQPHPFIHPFADAASRPSPPPPPPAQHPPISALRPYRRRLHWTPTIYLDDPATLDGRGLCSACEAAIFSLSPVTHLPTRRISHPASTNLAP